MDRFGFLGAFHFKVEFIGLDGDDIDTRFQSVAGLSASIETESVAEGGENRFKHLIPVRAGYGDITLKRGLVTSSKVVDWCRKTIESLEVRPHDLNVSLLNEEHEPSMTWQIKHAWPKKWSVADLNAESSAIVIESLELGCHYFTVAT